MQLTINSFRQLFPTTFFPWHFPDFFGKIPDISLTAVKFPDISRFSRQVVTLCSTGLVYSFRGATFTGYLNFLFPGVKSAQRELAFHGTFAPCNFRPCGPFVPWERTFQELVLHGTYIPRIFAPNVKKMFSNFDAIGVHHNTCNK